MQNKCLLENNDVTRKVKYTMNLTLNDEEGPTKAELLEPWQAT